MNRKNIVDDIIAYLGCKPNGVSSLELAETFLKFKTPDTKIAHTTIKEILKNDIRCTFKSDNRWYSEKTIIHLNKQRLQEIPWVTIYLLSNPHEPPGSIYHISIWSLFETPDCILSEWMIDPNRLPHGEREILLDSLDSPFTGKQSAFVKIANALEGRTTLFFSYRQQRNFFNHAVRAGISITDDSMLVSQLYKINKIVMPKPINLMTCYNQLFNREPLIKTARYRGKAFSECARELLSKLSTKGVTSWKQFEQLVQRQTMLSTWKEARFSLLDILQLPQTPGVYGFKNKIGEYIYIGKAKNMKKRLVNYFRNTEESPEKLIKLRDQAYEFTIYTCGSELECLILEYRLIKKYSPILNSKLDINERKGSFRPLHDCIIILPHSDTDKCMTVWFRENQKILLKPLLSDFSERENIVDDLGQFFFSEVLSPANSDFPEQEIIFRWVKQHEDTLLIIPVYRMSSPEDIYTALKSTWNCSVE